MGIPLCLEKQGNKEEMRVVLLASLMEEMLDVLQKENGEYNKLLSLSEEKTQALIKSDITRILEISEKEQEVVDVIKKCEAKCDEVIADMGIVLGRDTQKLTVAEVVDLLSRQPGEQQKLRTTYDELVRTAGKMKDSNERNKILVNQAMELLEFDLTLYRSLRMAPETANYSKDALNTASIQGNGRFDTKQ